MRLLNVKTYCLEQYYEPDIPPYAILSHRWGEEEILFADLEKTNFKNKKAFPKVRLTCEQAVRDGLDYVWIDTLSINKESSAELSEAINSMFRWYQDAAVCYAFLGDIQIQLNVPDRSHQFVSSQWFKRGWTLQELIAPKKVVFFDSTWNYIGERHSLRKRISKFTTIEIGLLQDDRKPLEQILPTLTIAKRMSWAAHRDTSRLEDRAYSLMGLFGVNMPLLYGEGRKAFVRLQEEIIKTSTDLSILAWGTPRSDQEHRSQFLAADPSDFENCTTICPAPTTSFADLSSSSLSIVSSGLRIEKPFVVLFGENKLALSLECRHENDVVTVLALRLWCTESRSQEEQRKRYGDHGDLCYVDSSASNSRVVSVRFFEPHRSPEWPTLMVGRGFHAFDMSRMGYVQEHTHISVQLPPSISSTSPWKVLKCWPAELWDLENLVFDLRHQSFLDALSPTLSTPKKRQVYGALALQSHLGRVMLLFAHQFVARYPHGSIESYIHSTLAPFQPESFFRGSQPKFTELNGVPAHSLQLEENHVLRVERAYYLRYGLHIAHLKLCLDLKGGKDSH